jgi:hypothetical protein
VQLVAKAALKVPGAQATGAVIFALGHAKPAGQGVQVELPPSK